MVIAGQGTIGMEIVKQMGNAQDLDMVFASVGGGGLVGGISEYVKHIRAPGTKVVRVETIDGDAMARSLEKGEHMTLREELRLKSQAEPSRAESWWTGSGSRIFRKKAELKPQLFKLNRAGGITIFD